MVPDGEQTWARLSRPRHRPIGHRIDEVWRPQGLHCLPPGRAGEVGGEVVEPLQDGDLVAQAEVEGDQVAVSRAGGSGGSPVVLVGLEPGGVDRVVSGEELGDLSGVEVSGDTMLVNSR